MLRSLYACRIKKMQFPYQQRHLIPEMEGETVFIYSGGKAKSTKVVTGLRTESKIQITEGLKFGDTLITSGIMQLRQNLPVSLDTVILNK